MKYWNGLKLCSFNGVINLVRITRNTGKTWNFEYRQWKRAIKHGKTCIWLRTFKKEVKEVRKKLYRSADLQKKCGIIPYDNETKKGNFKVDGNTFYCRKHDKAKWIPFLELFALSDANALRSADNVDMDTIIWDEADATQDKQRRYRGNMIQDFIDIFISAKRNHKVICFLMCNKESIRNPLFTYFKLPHIPSKFNGFRRFKKGSIIVEQRNMIPPINNEYDKKVDDLLNDTAYGNYLKGTYKNAVNIKKRQTPKNAQLYFQLDLDYPIKICYLDGNYYVSKGVDINRRVCTLKTLNKYQNELLLIKRYKNNFIAFMDAIADNRVYYEDDVTYEAIQLFYEWLGI